MQFCLLSFILNVYLFLVPFALATRILILRICISYFFLRNYPCLSFWGTGTLFWAWVFLSQVIGLTSEMNFVRTLKRIFFGLLFQGELRYVILMLAGAILVTPFALFAEDARPSTIVFGIVLRSNAFGFIFLPYHLRS